MVEGEPEWFPIACDKTCTLSINIDMLKVTDPINSSWGHQLPTMRHWAISGDGLVDYTKMMGVQSLQQLAINRTPISVRFQAENSKAQKATYYGGTGYIQQVTETGPVGQAASFTYQIVGDSNLDIDNQIPPDGGGGHDDMAQVFPLQFITSEGQTTYHNTDLIGAKLLFLSIDSEILYTGNGDYQKSGLNSETGTITWNYEASAGNECIVLYKK